MIRMRTALRRRAYAASRGIAGTLMIQVHCLVLFLAESTENLPHCYKKSELTAFQGVK
jgi:hypothetical protein